VYYYNGAQRYEQFLQVGWLYRALVFLSLALFRAPLCLRSSWCYICITFFCLHLSLYFYWAEPGEIGPWPSWLTIVLQCYDTVGWVMWPVKLSEMTYNVSSGMLNTTILYRQDKSRWSQWRCQPATLAHYCWEISSSESVRSEQLFPLWSIFSGLSGRRNCFHGEASFRAYQVGAAVSMVKHLFGPIRSEQLFPWWSIFSTYQAGAAVSMVKRLFGSIRSEELFPWWSVFSGLSGRRNCFHGEASFCPFVYISHKSLLLLQLSSNFGSVYFIS